MNNLSGIRKHLPLILTSLGVVGSAAVGVSASIAQHKVDKEVEDLLKDNGYETEVIKPYVKYYWPTAIIFALTSGCIIGSNRLSKREYDILLKAYGSLGAGFAAYRGAVIEEYGKKKDEEFMEKAAECVVNYDSYILDQVLPN